MKLRSIVLSVLLTLTGVAAHAAGPVSVARSTLPRLTLTPDLNDFQTPKQLSEFVALRVEQLSPKVGDSEQVAAVRGIQRALWKACAWRGCIERIEHDFVLTKLQLAISNVGRPGQPDAINQQTASNVYMYLDSRKPVGLALDSQEGAAWVLMTMDGVPTERLEALDELHQMRAGLLELKARAFADSTFR